MILTTSNPTKSKNVKGKIIGYLSLTLVLALIVLILLSWLLSATMGEGVRSLLSAEGIRFFFGSFTDMLLHPLLVWILLLAMAWGCVSGSGILQVFFNLTAKGNKGRLHYRRHSLLLPAVLLIIYVAAILWLSITPHAVLLSATGGLWPSAFSRALVPLIAFGLILLSTSYGIASRRFLSLADICQSLTAGLASSAPLLLLYVLMMQLLASLRFVFSF